MKVPKARKLPSGMWFIQLRLGGESIPVTEETEKKCTAEARRIKAEYLAGKRDAPKGDDITLGQAIDRYIKSRDGVLSPATIRSYKMDRKLRFKEYMDVSIRKIDWQEMINEEAKKTTGKGDKRKKLSGKTIKNAWGLVSTAVNATTKQRPKDVTLPQVVTRHYKFLEPEQIPIFVQEIRGKPWEMCALLALHSLTASEIWGVDGMKIDLENDIIKVDGAKVRTFDSGMVLKPENKNTARRRNVPIFIPRLKEAVNEMPDRTVMVCEMPQSTVRDNINRTCRKLGFDEVGIHGLRHTFASLCYDLEISEQATMEMGGWSDYATMRKIYTHLASRSRDDARKNLSNFFENANGNANE